MNKNQYIVVEAATRPALQEAVNTAMTAGYFPIGGITSSGDHLRGTLILMQPMQLAQAATHGPGEGPAPFRPPASKKGSKHQPKPQDATR